jgi:TRAP-type C4-dicarboxylate transport system permease small subunit
MMIKMRPILSGVLGWHDIVSQALYRLGIVALGLIVIIFSYEILLRYFLGTPTRWASDFVSFLLLIKVFLVLPWLTRSGGNVAVTVINDQMPEKVRKFMIIMGYLIASITCIYLGYIVFLETLTLYSRGTRTLSTVSIPRWILYAFICYGLINAGLYFLRLVFQQKTIKPLEVNQ